MASYVDRYSQFRNGNSIKPIPGIIIPSKSTDLSYPYKQGLTRLDKLSNMFYNNPWSGWLIMAANPQYGGLEFNIPDMTSLTIPFPYEDAVSRYINEIKNHKLLYGE